MLSIFINFIQDTFAITGDVNSTVLFFTVLVTALDSNQTCSVFSISTNEADCYGVMCIAVIDPHLNDCSVVSDTISLSVLASNQLGNGPLSDIYTLGKLIVSDDCMLWSSIIGM